MTSRTTQAELPTHSRRNAVIACVISMIAIGSTIPTAAEPFTRDSSWLVYANLLSGLVPTLAWLVGLVLVLKNRVATGVQVGLIASLIAIPATSYWAEGVALANAIAVGVGATIIAGVCLRANPARWYMGAGIVAALASLVIDVLAPHPRLITEQGAPFIFAVTFLAVIALVMFLFLQFPRYALRTKLIIVFVGMALLSTLAITLFASDAIRNNLNAQSAQDLRTRAQAAALAVGLTIESNVDRLTTMALDKRVQNDVAIISDSYPAGQEALSQLIANNAARWSGGNAQEPVIRNALNGELASSLSQFGNVFLGNTELFMTDNRGSVVAAQDWQPTYNFGQAQWWRNAYNDGRGAVYIGQPEYNEMIKDYGVQFAVPIYAEGRTRVVGVIHSIYTLDALQRSLLLNRFGNSGKIDLLFPRGEILTSEGTFRTLQPAEFHEIKMDLDVPLATLNYRGTPLLSSQGVVVGSDEQAEAYLRSTDWRTIATIRADEALGAVQAATRAALTAGLVTIGIAVLFALLLAQFLTRPIRRLTTVAEQVQAGDLSARAAVESSDEIGMLAQGFNNMTARLQDTLASLESRVTERTRELSLVNEELQSNGAYLSALSDTSSGLFQRLDVTQVLGAIVERAGALIGTQHGFVFFAEPDQDEIEMRVGSGLYDDLIGTRAQRGVGVAGTVWQTGVSMVIEDYQKWEGRLPGSRRDALHAIVAVPLVRASAAMQGSENVAHETVGVIGLAFTDPAYKFDKPQIQVLERFAQLASIALDNARLFEQTQQALAETERLAARERDSSEQVRALNRRLTREGWRDYLDQTNSRLIVEADGGNSASNGSAHTNGNGSTNGGGGQTLTRVPIQLRGQVIGEIELESDEDQQPLTDDEMGLVTHVAENLGLALDNARLFTETQRRVTELDALNQISQAVTTELTLDPLLNLIGDQVRSIFDVESAYIALYDQATGRIELPYFVDKGERVWVEALEFGQGISSEIIRTRAPLVINRDADTVMAQLGARTIGATAQSYLGVPIIVGEDVIGVISIQSTQRQGMFDQANVRLMETIAATVGAAIQNAQLYGAMQQEVVTRQRAEQEIKLSLKEKEVLLKEIHHRVKNNLQIITSLLNLQSAQFKDPEASAMFRESQARVRSMALIHEKLYQSKDLARVDFDAYVRDLTVYLFRSYGSNPDQIRTTIEMGGIFLAIDTAIPCGLIISELVTNTLKYAFPDGKRGELYLGLAPVEGGHLVLQVRDTGVGFPEDFDWRESDSLGLQLVSTLAAQLHGKIEVNGKGGTSFAITFHDPS